MTKTNLTRIQDLLGLANSLYPPDLAEDWDNVGLQVGDPQGELRRVMVCLDPSLAAVEAARRAEAQALVTHHPLIFKPLKRITPTDETGQILFAAINQGIAILSIHTNLDRAANGLNDWLADCLGLTATQPLLQDLADLVKLVVFVPSGHEEAVAQALFAHGAGQVGNYSECSFRTAGQGTFKPGAGTDPFLGSVGKRESVDEIRLETILPAGRISRVLNRMLKAHPYDEVAYDLLPLANRRKHEGLGRIGRLPEVLSLEKFAVNVKTALDVNGLRVVGDPQGKIGKVALCGGSGSSLLHEAARQGADVLVTGDVKYHEARAAESMGVALIDAGHFGTERFMADGLANVLREAAANRNLDLEIIAWKEDRDPFRFV